MAGKNIEQVGKEIYEHYANQVSNHNSLQGPHTNTMVSSRLASS